MTHVLTRVHRRKPAPSPQHRAGRCRRSLRPAADAGAVLRARGSARTTHPPAHAPWALQAGASARASNGRSRPRPAATGCVPGLQTRSLRPLQHCSSSHVQLSSSKTSRGLAFAPSDCCVPPESPHRSAPFPSGGGRPPDPAVRTLLLPLLLHVRMETAAAACGAAPGAALLCPNTVQ